MTLKGNAVIGQSGGPTAVINQSLVGVIEGLMQSPGHENVKQILGARHAVRGIINDDFIDLTGISQDMRAKLGHTSSAALGSSRDKPDAAYCERIFEVFKKRDVRFFFYIGGNDSSDTCRLVNETAKADGYELRCFHVPKTIDNDLVCNDHTPGFGSAAKFVAQAFIGDNMDNKALPGIKINIIMGRHAGFLTAASMLGRRPDSDDGPHLIYVPEVAFSQEKFLADVDRVYTKHGRCLIAMSEGVHYEDGTPLVVKAAKDIETDAHGNVQLSGSGALGDVAAGMIREGLGVKRVRADTFGYLQRAFMGIASNVDGREARRSGFLAAAYALSGDRDGSITINRVSDDPYDVEYGIVDLAEIAAKTKLLDTKYVIDGCDIDQSYHTYAFPLTGGLPFVVTLDKFPRTSP